MLAKLRSHFIGECQNVWKYLTMQLNLIGSTMLAFILAYPDLLTTGLRQLPAEVQSAVPVIVPMAWFGLVAFARFYKQFPVGGSDGPTAK